MKKPTALILTGYGINCEEETAFAFSQAGAEAVITHINDVIAHPITLTDSQIVVFPGGFSFGDDTGAGNALASRLQHTLGEQLVNFVQQDKLILGICNGFQVLVSLGLLPALYDSYGLQQVALMPNYNARYTVRWVDLKILSTSPWLQNIKKLSLPIAHGEGKFFASDTILDQLKKKKLIAAKYVQGEICDHFDLEANPNGSLEDIAGITDVSGKVLGIMPHPERGIFFTQLPHWPYLKEQLVRKGEQILKEGAGMQIFKNAVRYFG